MDRVLRELLFGSVLAATTGFLNWTYWLAFVLDPLYRSVFSILVVTAAVLLIIPKPERATAGLIGLPAVFLAGVIIPHTMRSGTELATVSLYGGIILILAFTSLRLTVFQNTQQA